MSRNYANNVSEFLEWVPEVRSIFDFKKDDPWVPWFRGQRACWNLRPKLYREEYGGYARRRKHNIEDEIREEFIVRAPILSETPTPADDEWGWYFLMQHYGTPTRLLDWTEAALLALYFAVKNNQGLYDSVVWALDPYALNEKVIGNEWVICPSATGVTKRDKNRVKPWLPDRFTKMAGLPERPIAVYPTHIARRVSTQRSGFTIHGTDPQGLERMAGKRNGCLIKITIPSFKVQAVRRELEACGIDESTIFPDLDGLSRSLCLKWRLDCHKLPHEKVYTRLRPSSIHGVGVFAIRNIKKDTPLFVGDNEEMLWVEERRLPRFPRQIRKLYEDFPVIKEKRYGCPQNFNRLTMSWYLNEPKRGNLPNVYCDPQENYDFKALRDIKAGEELTVRYKDYSDLPACISAGLRTPAPKEGGSRSRE